MKLRIGYISDNYPERRNIISRVQGVAYINIAHSNFYAYINKLNFVLKRMVGRILFRTEYYRYRRILPARVDGLHFFNSFSFSSFPNVITFETLLPYYWAVKNDFKDLGQIDAVISNTSVKRALDSISGETCKKLIALSENTKNMQLKFLELFPDHRASIANKITVLHPPQQLFGVHPYKKQDPDCFELVFVGRAFYRKGGLELIRALEMVRKSINIKLYLISSLDPEAGWFNLEEKRIGEDLEWISKMNWIEHLRNIPNTEVIELLRRCHLGFLPTWQDTYGYSVLEMQACGCPVISTNIRSLSEINNNQCGWLINVPKNEWSEWDLSTLGGEHASSEWLIQQIKEVTIEALSDTDVLGQKSCNAIQRIEQEHDPIVHGLKLAEIYQHSFLKD